jgi:hypothetical protein
MRGRSDGVTLGNGRRFASKSAAREYVVELLRLHDVGDTVSGVAATDLAGLLDLHPRRAEKVGAGVAGFVVLAPPPHRTRCFGARRVDGTVAHFSMLECLKPSTERDRVLAACRAAARPDTLAFKAAAFGSGGPVPCAVSGVPVTWDDAHVDHAPPVFLEIVEQWRAGRPWASFDVRSGGDDLIGDELAEADRASFRAFHARTANLRVVAARVNLSDLRRRRQ